MTSHTMILAAGILGALYPLGCMAQDGRHFVREVVHRWDSALHSAPLRTEEDGVAAEGLRRWIGKEFEVLYHSPSYNYVESYVDRAVDTAAFVLRVTNRLDHVGTPDTVFERDHKLIKIYSVPPLGQVWWIIGNLDGTVRIIYPLPGGKSLVDTTLPCALPLMDSLQKLDRDAYTIAPGPETASIISAWSPNTLSNTYVFAFHNLKKDPYFIEKWPRVLHWIASLAWDQRCE